MDTYYDNFVNAGVNLNILSLLIDLLRSIHFFYIIGKIITVYFYIQIFRQLCS